MLQKVNGTTNRRPCINCWSHHIHISISGQQPLQANFWTVHQSSKLYYLYGVMAYSVLLHWAHVVFSFETEITVTLVLWVYSVVTLGFFVCDSICIIGGDLLMQCLIFWMIQNTEHLAGLTLATCSVIVAANIQSRWLFLFQMQWMILWIQVGIKPTLQWFKPEQVFVRGFCQSLSISLTLKVTSGRDRAWDFGNTLCVYFLDRFVLPHTKQLTSKPRVLGMLRYLVFMNPAFPINLLLLQLNIEWCWQSCLWCVKSAVWSLSAREF